MLEVNIVFLEMEFFIFIIPDNFLLYPTPYAFFNIEA